MDTSSSDTEIADNEQDQFEGLVHTAVSDIGRRREENQDSFGIIEKDNFRFFIVADGMGGVKGGAIASKSAIEVVTETLSVEQEMGVQTIVSAVTRANADVFEKGTDDPGLTGMGTTFVGICFAREGLYIVNVGDSRAYRFRSDQIAQLTEDHTLVTELLRSGAISPEQVENHPVSHMLTRSLGPTPVIEVDCWLSEENPAVEDVYLLCSDGLYNLVADQEMAEIIRDNPLDDAAEKLVALANERGGTDNITIILIQVEEDLNIIESENAETRITEVSDTLKLSEGIAADVDEEIADQQKTNGKGSGEVINNDSEDDNPEITLELDGDSEDLKADEEEEEEEDVTVSVEAATPDLMSRLSAKAVAQQQEDPEPAVTEEKEIEQESKELEPEQELKSQLKTEEMDSRADRYFWASIVFAVASVSFALLWYFEDGEVNEVGNVSLLQQPEANQESAAKELKGVVKEGPLVTKPDKGMVVERDLTPKDQPEGDSSAEKAEETALANKGLAGDNEGVQGDPSSEQVTDYLESIKDVELAGIHTRRLKLRALINRLSERLAAFSEPLSGNVGDRLKETYGRKEKLLVERNAVRSKMNYATRRLAVWYGRKKRLKTEGELQLAAEVAASSEAVRERRIAFEEVTYQYLKENDSLSYNPSDKSQKMKVNKLLKDRKNHLRLLKQDVREAIEAELRESDNLISELTLRRDEIEEKIVEIQEEEQFVKVLIGHNQAAKDKLKKKLTEEKRLAEIELKEIISLIPNQSPGQNKAGDAADKSDPRRL